MEATAPLSFDTEVATYLPLAVDRIVEAVDPERIILFGSRARGDARPDSDVDLLVVFRHLSDKRETARTIGRLLGDRKVPVDIVVADLDEIQSRGNVIGTVLREALREGQVLFERN